MSYHNHDPEERLPRKKVEAQLLQNIEKDVEKAQAARDAEIAEDIMMLDRLREFDLTEKDIRWIRHLIGLPNGRGIPMLVNWVQGRTGSCVLHYHHRHIDKMPLRNFNNQ